MLMDISIIICTKDRPDELSECVGSIQRQSVKPGEIIIVDASNSDETKNLCQVWRNRDLLRIKYIRSKPHLTHQRNLGVASSVGKFIFFFDDDVVLDEGYLENISE